MRGQRPLRRYCAAYEIDAQAARIEAPELVEGAEIVRPHKKRAIRASPLCGAVHSIKTEPVSASPQRP